MDIEKVEDEIYNFCLKYFKSEIRLAQDCEDYIIVHDLPTPKENYALLAKFLNSLVRRMADLDSTIISKTLLKLSQNIKILYNELVNLEKKTIDYNDVFFNEFIEFSDILQASKEFENYKRLENVYFEIFKDMFYQEAKTLKVEINNSLNVLSYYNDKLLWIEARKSHFIKKHFEINGIPGVLDSKNYLTNALTLMRKNTKEYDYYMSCIRIFK